MSGNDADDRKQGHGTAEDDLSGRLRGLDQALKKARAGSQTGEEGQGAAKPSSAHGMAQALKISSEFIAGVAVGAGLGWFTDYLFSTSPWGLIVFLLLGFAAGVLNVLRGVGMASSSGRPDHKA